MTKIPLILQTKFRCGMNFKFYRIFIATTILSNSMYLSGSELATARRDTTLNLHEVSITAVKTITDKEKGAGATTEISRPLIERLNMVSSKNISSVVPNMYIPDYGSRVTSSIYVRGIGARIDQPVVGLNIDNIPVMNKDNYDFDILDIEQVEVMRGPQSTLYGRNTMGGVINIRTLSPLSFQGARILAEYGNANSIKAGVAHYARISDKFGIGGNIYGYHTDGFFTNMNDGEKCDKENNLRASLKLGWKPNERLTLENVASFSLVRQGGYAYESADTREINYNDTCFYRRNSVMDGLTIGWKNDNITVTGVTSYQYIDDNMTLDQDFLPLSYFTMSQIRKEHAITEDIVVKGNGDKTINWLAGAFGFYKHADINAPVTFKDYGIENLIVGNWNGINTNYPMKWDSDEFILGSRFTIPNYGLAAYGEVSAEWNNFTVIGGLRLDYEQSRLHYRSDCSTSYTIYHNNEVYKKEPIEIHSSGDLKRSFLQLLPKISVVYELPAHGKLYASVKKGYKAGGFNTQMFSDVLQQELMGKMGIGKKYDINDVVGYKPETSWNYEVGSNLEFFDSRLLADVAAFYIDCRDQQLTVFPDGTTTGRIMTNAGKTRSFGAEVALTARPVNRLELRASYGYTNAKFVEFNNGKNNYAGKVIPYAPQNTIFAGATYSFKIGNDFLRYITVGANVNGIGKIYWNEANTAEQPFYALLNANVKFIGEKYSLDFWTKNLTGTQYNTFYFVSIEHEFLQRGKPLQIGATLRINI